MRQEKKSEDFSEMKERIQQKPYFNDTCIVHIALMILADKWVMMILLSLITGKKRNAELQKLIVGISPKMLSQSLKKLVNYGMVSRKVYPKVPPRVEYRLTDFGFSVMPTLSALFDWSMTQEEAIRKAWGNAQR